MSAIEMGIVTETTKNRMKELEGKKIDLQISISQAEMETQKLTREQVAFWLKNMEKLNLASKMNRQRIINTFLNSIYVYDDKFIVNFNCREESDTIALDFKGDVSYLNGIGEPITHNPNTFVNSDVFGFLLFI